MISKDVLNQVRRNHTTSLQDVAAGLEVEGFTHQFIDAPQLPKDHKQWLPFRNRVFPVPILVISSSDKKEVATVRMDYGYESDGTGMFNGVDVQFDGQQIKHDKLVLNFQAAFKRNTWVLVTLYDRKTGKKDLVEVGHQVKP